MSFSEVNKHIQELEEVGWFHNSSLSGGRLLSKEEEQILGMSMTLILVHGVNQRIVNNGSNADYYVLGGRGYFHIGVDGSIDTRLALPGEKISITKGIPYWDVAAEGEGLLMLAINHPAYDPAKVQVLDKPPR